ncbi:MAG: hypothetical protein KJ000_01470 [Pirellulaceae bacterium]|nr:hypothetical protein [Pirellulaceae bacterium]
MRTRNIFVGTVLAFLAIAASPVLGQESRSDRNVSTAVPMISIETSVPNEIDINTSATFVVSVTNAGKSLAEGVSLQITLPQTVKFQEASPVPNLTGERLVQYEIGDLPAGAVRRFSLQLVPLRQGPVDLQTKAFFSASTQSALQVRQPQITIDCQAPEATQIGETVTFRVLVRNIGDGAARDVVVTPKLPQSSYLDGKEPQPATVPLLQAGETKELKFTARAAEGQWLESNFIAALRGQGDVECGKRVRIMRPDLQIDLDGTRVSFLNKEGEYAIRVWNPGDMMLRAVHITLKVPAGLQVSTISRAAKIDSQRRVFEWCIPELAPGASETLMLKANATVAGAHIQNVDATSEPRLTAQDDHRTLVLTRPDVDVAVRNTKEAIEVGNVEEFSVLLVNRGTKSAEHVDLQVLLPAAIQAVESDDYELVGQQLTFPQMPLAVGEEKVLKFRAIGANAGDHAVRAIVQADYSTQPTIAETTVYFYDDEELERVARDMDAGVMLR